MEDKKIDKETAAADFERWAAFFDIDTDIEDFDERDKKAFFDFKGRFVKRVMAGRLLVFEDHIEYTPRDDKGSIKIYEPNSGQLIKQPNDTELQSSRRSLAAWTGEPAKRFADMPLRDFTFLSLVFGSLSNS